MPGGRPSEQRGRRRVDGHRPQQRAKPHPRPLVVPADVQVGQGQRPDREHDQDQRGDRHRPPDAAEQHTQPAAQHDQGRAGGGLRDVGGADAARHTRQPGQVGDDQDTAERRQRQHRQQVRQRPPGQAQPGGAVEIDGAVAVRAQHGQVGGQQRRPRQRRQRELGGDVGVVQHRHGALAPPPQQPCAQGGRGEHGGVAQQPPALDRRQGQHGPAGPDLGRNLPRAADARRVVVVVRRGGRHAATSSTWSPPSSSR
jgi:hypothetical protein